MFTDIEGSTKLWEEFPEGMKSALASHDAILRRAVAACNGTVVKSTGDGCHAAFDTAADALTAALEAQRALQAESWPGIRPYNLKVRTGIHTGEAEKRAGDYFGPALNRAARLMAVGHGGQILLSGVTAELGRDLLPPQAQLLDLGEHRLKDLARPEHIFQLVHPALPSSFPPLKTLDTYPNNLPVQVTSFIGRAAEIDEIKRLLSTARLVTLTGSGGTGKTRLSQEAAAQMIPDFPDGLWLIELGPLSDPAQITPALAQVFGLQELPFTSLANIVLDYLRAKKLLLLLDNCEHLIEACARLADDLLHQCAGLKILASSREALGIAGEVAYHVPSLSDSESTQLFLDRAQAANSSFHLTESNTAAIAQICQRLDGIPLAIELAAARSRLLSPEQIAARLGDRFRLLVGGSRTALPRQQTLRALIDWSYDLLTEEEQRLLQYASVFAGGWTLEALEAVAGNPDTLELLDQLVNKSLVVTEECGREMRYSMLETIRQYAREKLFDAKLASEARDRHFAYYDSLSEKMWESFRALDGLIPLRDLVYDELENMRGAIEWGLENHPETVLHLVANFAIVSTWTGSMIEGLEWLKVAIDRFHSLPPPEGGANGLRQAVLAKALFAQGMVSMAAGGVQLARHSLDEAIALTRLTGDKRLRGYALEMSYIAAGLVNPLDAAGYAEEGFAIFNEVEDSWGMSMALMNQARIALARGDSETSREYLGLLKAKMKETPLSFMSGTTYLGMGYAEREQGRYDLAKGYFEEGWKIFRRLRHNGFENVLFSEIGHIARLQGKTSEAKEIYRQTITRFQDMGNRAAVSHQLECFAHLAIAEGEPSRAARLFGAAEALRQRIDSQMADHERLEYEASLERLQSMLPAGELEPFWMEGRSLSMEQAIELAKG